MSLTGNLEVFPLQEVLRLLARARKSGCLRVDSNGVPARVYLDAGSITSATTSEDEDQRRSIMNAGLVSDEDLRQVEIGNGNLKDVLGPGVSPALLTDFIREQVVESLYRIRKPGHGNFDFVVDMAARFPTGVSVDVEVAISESERRAAEWADIETVIPDLSAPISMTPELAEEANVTIGPGTWRLLAALGGSSTIPSVAQRLGSTEFRIAKEAATLVRSGLIDVSVEQPAVEFTPAGEDETASVGSSDAGAWFEEATPAPAPAVDEVPAEDSAPDEQPIVFDVAPEPSIAEDQNTQQETVEAPAEDMVAITEPEPDPTVAVEAASDDTSADGGWWHLQQEQSRTSESTDESESFLENVFSQLTEEPVEEESESESAEETGFGMGLLRRRRMGAIARDLSDEA